MGLNGCSALKFDPTLTLQPETTAAESPTGVEVELKVPQREGLAERATANIRDVTVSFPEGMAVNPAAASGRSACSSAQVDLAHGADRPSCPDSAKIGSVEVSTPLLDHTLPGSVYVAQPYDNPFNTLLAVYVVIDSPEDGIVVKLAGRTEADPSTGELTTTFRENPELPVASFKVDLFGGPRAALRTPATCGTYTTHSVQTPWSGNPPVETEPDSFQVAEGANGGPCRSSEAQMPHSPGFEAGTETPIAASYSPFLGYLSRERRRAAAEGPKRHPAPGPDRQAGRDRDLLGCSNSRSLIQVRPTGAASPSCPASSEIGEVAVGAGAGPAPYYTSGKVYLAGPYKGAPLSGVAITPAVAGPFDLGTVVVRVPAYVDPITAQLNLRSDDFPRSWRGSR